VLLGVVWITCLAGAENRSQDAQTNSVLTPAASSPPQVSSDQSAPDDPRKVIAEHLALGNVLFQRGDYLAAQAEFRAVLQVDATQHDALQFMTEAQSRLDTQRARVAREQKRVRHLAEDLSSKFAREKEKAQVQHDAQAREQLAKARDQQLKFLYRKGLAFYRQGDYQSAIDAFQQMAPIDPAHLLVREAQQFITKAETKQAEARAKASARLSPTSTPAVVPELEQQLTAKRIEIETRLKYVKLALNDQHYDMAIELLQRVLALDPQHREAQQLLDQVQTAKLKDEEGHLLSRVRQDEQKMVNEVVKAQLLPEAKTVPVSAPSITEAGKQAMEAKLQEPISLDFKDVALPDVLEFIGDAVNISIIPSPRINLKDRRVSFKVTQLPLELALKYLVKNQSLAYRIEQGVILISMPEELLNQPMQTQVFFLRNGLGPFSLETAAVTQNPALAMDSLKDLILQSVPQPAESKLIVDERSGALVSTNTSENLRLIEQLLRQLDVTPVQVLIEARFMEVTMSELEQLGVEAVLTGDYALSKVNTAPHSRDPGTVIAKGGGFKFPDLSRQDEGANLTLEGVLTGAKFEAVLHMLEESKKSKTLSAPRVTALNNQTAQIKVVEEFNYPTRYEVSLVQFDINGDGDFDDAGETQFVNVPKDFKKRDVGILLNVTPSVGKDMKTVTLVLAPEVSQFTQFRDLGGGVSVPEFTSSALATSVVIEDGQTAVLGGLMKDTTSYQLTKVPVLGDLPMVGNLFRQKEAKNERKNLLIFITAHVLGPRGQTI